MSALGFHHAFCRARDGAWLRAHRDGDPDDVFAGSMSMHDDGRISIAVYDEFERVEYRQRFKPSEFARALRFVERRYLFDLVSWSVVE